MATKNGICPHCQFNRLDRRIFPVNPEAVTVYCPYCMRELDPKKSIELYNNIITKMLDKADNTLFVACDPVTAYLEYAEVLEVENHNPKALLGRILCLIYTSKVRKTYLSEANELLGEISYKGTEEVTNYVGFLKRINFALDEYDLALLKKLSIHKQFYDEECLKLYITRLVEIIEFKKDILDSLNKIKKDYITQKNDVLINLVSHSISEKENSLKTTKFLITGVGYKITRAGTDRVSINETGETINTHYNKGHLYTLNENDKRKGKKVIDDQVFRDYTPIIRMKKISIYMALTLMLAATGLGLASYFFINNQILFPVFIALAALCVVGFVILTILHFIWKSLLKKRKIRID